jgi:hypothetical protein
MIPNLLDRPICSVSGCKDWRQTYSITGKVSYLKTCRRHTYKDIRQLSKEIDNKVQKVLDTN